LTIPEIADPIFMNFNRRSTEPAVNPQLRLSRHYFGVTGLRAFSAVRKAAETPGRNLGIAFPARFFP
jgi:hypothetical protein